MVDFSVSIIIPAWDEESVIVDCLDSLRRLDYPLDICELVVVAGGTDSTYETAQGCNVNEFGIYKVSKQLPEDGRVGAVLRGLSEAKKEIIVVLDADTIVDKSWLKELTKTLRNGDFDAVNGTALPVRGRKLFSIYYSIENMKQDYDNVPRLNGAASIAIKQSILEKHGADYFFDRNAGAAASVNLFRRLREKEYKIGVAKDAIVYTYFSSSFKAFVSDQIRQQRGLYGIMREENFAIIKRVFRSMAVIAAFIPSVLSLFYGFSIVLIPFYAVFVLFILKTASRIIPSIKKDFTYIFYYLLYVLSHLIIHAVIIYVAISQLLGLAEGRDIHYKGERPSK